MLEMSIGIVLLQEPNLRVIHSSHFVSPQFSQSVIHSDSDNCCAAILHNANTDIKFINLLSTSDCTVALTKINDHPCFLISAYFDKTHNIDIDLLHLDKVIRAAPNGRFIVHADVNARNKIWFDMLTDPRGVSFNL